MDYHVSFDISFDGEDEPMTDKELADCIDYMLDSTAITVSNFIGFVLEE